MHARSVLGPGFAALLMGGATTKPAAPAEDRDGPEALISVLGNRVFDRKVTPCRGVAAAFMETTRGGTRTEAR